MKKEIQMLAFLAASLLFGCSDGGETGPGTIPVNGTPGGGSAPPPPLPSRPNYHYLGLLRGSMAGPDHIMFIGRCVDTSYLAGRSCLDTVTQDGIATTEENLRAGQIIELKTSGGSHTIDIRRTVVGPVGAVDPAQQTLTVLGQKVYVTNRTQGERDNTPAGMFDLASVAVGDWVSISGHFSAAGQVIATWIASEAAPGPLVLRGILVAKSDDTFGIGDLLIDFSAANLEGFPGGSPLPGDAVLLFAHAVSQGNVLSVETARYAGGLFDSEGYEIIEFNGFITAERGGFDFDISGYRIYYSTWDCEACNRFYTESKAVPVGTPVVFFNDPMGNTHLELSSMDVVGTSVTGPIDGIDSPGSSFTVAGFTIQTSPATHISADVEPWVGSDTLDITELVVGETVTVNGGVRYVPDHNLLASSVAPNGDGVQIQTFIYDRADPEIIFLGRSILTDSSTTLTACDNAGVCTAASPSWLFDNTDYFSPMLTIDIDPVAMPLRATHIVAVRDN